MQETNSALKIITPHPKNYFTLVVIGIFVIVWIFAEGKVIQVFVSGIFESKSNTISNLGGILFFWTLSCIYLAYRFLWHLAGKECVEIRDDSIKIQYSIFGLGRTKEYPIVGIKDFRLDYLETNYFGRSYFWGFIDGDIAFDYNSKTIRFGSGINGYEARQVFENILTRVPQLKPLQSKTG